MEAESAPMVKSGVWETSELEEGGVDGFGYREGLPSRWKAIWHTPQQKGAQLSASREYTACEDSHLGHESLGMVDSVGWGDVDLISWTEGETGTGRANGSWSGDGRGVSLGGAG